MRQKDELIDSLKQVRLSYAPLTNIGTYVDYSRIPQLHNPYLATPLSIQAYRNATSSSDQHRQNVIARLDRFQSSVRSPVRAPSATSPFQLDARAGKVGGQSDESDEDRASQGHAQPRRASSGSEDTPVSPNTLVESDIDPYPDDAVPIGLLASLASLAISSSGDTPSAATDKTRKVNAAAEDDEVVRVTFLSAFSPKREKGPMGELFIPQGVASRCKDFFMPGPALNRSLRKSLIEKTSPPDISVHKLVTPDDVEKLFDI
jgi:hypothetical protein